MGATPPVLPPLPPRVWGLPSRGPGPPCHPPQTAAPFHGCSPSRAPPTAPGPPWARGATRRTTRPPRPPRRPFPAVWGCGRRRRPAWARSLPPRRPRPPRCSPGSTAPALWRSKLGRRPAEPSPRDRGPGCRPRPQARERPRAARAGPRAANAPRLGRSGARGTIPAAPSPLRSDAIRLKSRTWAVTDVPVRSWTAPPARARARTTRAVSRRRPVAPVRTTARGTMPNNRSFRAACASQNLPQSLGVLQATRRSRRTRSGEHDTRRRYSGFWPYRAHEIFGTARPCRPRASASPVLAAVGPDDPCLSKAEVPGRRQIAATHE